MIAMSEAVFKKIKGHSLQESPKEACGILSGNTSENPRITRVFCCSNVDKNPYVAYTINPDELLKAIDEIEGDKKGPELMGFYHSHPFSSPNPSLVDMSRATWERFIYAIFSISEDRLKCWKWMGEPGGFIEEGVEIA
jgi:proteasome lid subunit RPN8/RPN11